MADPPAVVTVTLTLPTEWGGVVAAIVVGDSTTIEVAAAAPNRTEVAPVRSAPVSVTLVPPEVGPAVGDMRVSEGGGVT